MGAALFANTRQFTLNKVTGNIDQFKRLLADGLNKHLFTEVVDTPGEVAGNFVGQFQARASVLHLPISGNTFWQVIMAGGDDATFTKNVVSDVTEIITNLFGVVEPGGHMGQ
jgi:hypothetical protein